MVERYHDLPAPLSATACIGCQRVSRACGATLARKRGAVDHFPGRGSLEAYWWALVAALVPP